MADDTDLRKCSEYNDAHFGIPFKKLAFINIAKFDKNRAFDAEIGALLANLKNCARWLMTLTLENVQNFMTVILVSHMTHQHLPILPNLAKTVFLMLKMGFYWQISKTVLGA